MRGYGVIELVELNSLMGKFSWHVELRLVRVFFSEYKKCLLYCQSRVPNNELLNKKVKELEIINQRIETTSSGDIKLHLQKEIKEIVDELYLVIKSLNDTQV